MNYLTGSFSLFIVFTLSIFPAVLKASSNQGATESQSEKNSLPWFENYQNALTASKKQSKPIFLYFTGSDWCSWCGKMDQEILSQQEFKNLAGDKFIFVKVDFPIYKNLDDNTQKQNEELKAKYDIRGFPTVVILDPQERKIAVLNYRQGGGKSYAQYLLKLLEEQDQFQKGVNNLEKQNQEELQKLYLTARRQGMNNACERIVEVALSKEDSLFFSKEQYRLMLSEGKIDDPNTKIVRKKLLAQDPKNEQLLHYDVAILEFAAYAENLSNSSTADVAVKPLKDYLYQFGSQDKENRWRIEMTISQVLQSKNQLKEAVYYAKASKAHAPDTVKTAIANNISDLEQEMSSKTAMNP